MGPTSVKASIYLFIYRRPTSKHLSNTDASHTTSPLRLGANNGDSPIAVAALTMS